MRYYVRYKIPEELREKFTKALQEYKLWTGVAAKIYQSVSVSPYDKYLALLYTKRKMEKYSKEMDELELLSIGGLDTEGVDKLRIH